MAYRESDQLILLIFEEGADRIRSLQRITFAGQVGLEEQMQTSLQGIAKKAILICLLRKRVSLKSPVR